MPKRARSSGSCGSEASAFPSILPNLLLETPMQGAWDNASFHVGMCPKAEDPRSKSPSLRPFHRPPAMISHGRAKPGSCATCAPAPTSAEPFPPGKSSRVAFPPAARQPPATSILQIPGAFMRWKNSRLGSASWRLQGTSRLAHSAAPPRMLTNYDATTPHAVFGDGFSVQSLEIDQLIVAKKPCHETLLFRTGAIKIS